MVAILPAESGAAPFWVAIVCRGFDASGGWNCFRAFGRCTGLAQGLPLRRPRRSLNWGGRRDGLQVAEGCSDPILGWGVHQGTLREIPPHKGGPEARPPVRIQERECLYSASAWGVDRPRLRGPPRQGNPHPSFGQLPAESRHCFRAILGSKGAARLLLSHSRI